MSNLRCEFCGTSLNTPVTLKGVSPFRDKVFPKGFSLPKYFLAVELEITIECPPVKAVFGSPSTKGKENIVVRDQVFEAKVAVLLPIFDDPRNANRQRIMINQGASDPIGGLSVLKIEPRFRFGEHDGKRFLQGTCRISCQPLIAEEIHIRRIGKGNMRLFILSDLGNDPVWLARLPYQHAGVVGIQTGDGTEACGLPPQIGGKKWPQSWPAMLHAAGFGELYHNATDAIGVFVESVVTEFERHIQVDHQAGQDAESEAKDVDGRGQLMPAKTAQGKKKLLFYHVLEDVPIHSQKGAAFKTG